MKNLFRSIVLLSLAFIYVESNAQNFVLKAGLNLANLLDKDDSDTYSNDFKMNPGFHVGATILVPFSEAVSLETGLVLMTRGMKISEESGGFKLTANANLMYLDIPILVKGAYSLSDNTKMYGAIGPYIGIGLSGKAKATIDDGTTSSSSEEDIKWGNDENTDNLKRLDFGLSFGAGVEISSFLVGVSYDLGLSNISTIQDGGTTIKNRVLKFSLGYLISK